MAKKKKDRINTNDGKPSKLEKQIATYVRFNCPTKKTMLSGDEVHYFTGAKAVDCLMDSKWAIYKCKKEPIFTSRSSAVDFMQTILDKGMIWRARKLVPKVKNKDKEDMKVKGKSSAEGPECTEKKEKDEDVTKPFEHKDVEPELKDDDKKKDKKKRKVKLEFITEGQFFKDGPDVYVWHFDPTSWMRFFVGLGIVLGAVLFCLFPLWPSWLRLGVYYLSLCAMGLIGLLFALIIVRGLVYALVWVCTGGKHHMWLLPNLTEDCGFFESFVPLYTHTCPSNEKKRKEPRRRKFDVAEEEVDDNQKQEDPKGDGGDSDNSKGDAATDLSDAGTASQSSQSSLQNTPQKPIRRRPRREDNGDSTNGFVVVD